MEGAMTVPIDQLRQELLEYEFPPGSYTITEWQHWLTMDAILSPPLPAGIAHPIYAYLASIGGMGITLPQLFAAARSSAEAGVMFGEATLEFSQPLAVGATYRVEGRFLDVVRKQSSRVGTMDLVTFRLSLLTEDGTLAATSTNTFIFPRRES
ncbi:MAG: hypothetical protein KatS3mg011_2364 [Acidimicrobiia bacterium]|nr:MAG: hypothetical protein KatS3mg011_2364 [Acidimicrobiia bacterium]